VGLEPTTPCLKGRCSNQLSYGPATGGELRYFLTLTDKIQLNKLFPIGQNLLSLSDVQCICNVNGGTYGTYV
jgi:hypothetical protein